MSIYLTFHQAKLNKEDAATQILFGLKNNMHVGLQQLISAPVRNPRNPNQLEVAEKVEILPSEYNRFETPDEAYEAVVHFLSEEFKITFDEEVCFAKEDLEQSKKNKSLYFYLFEHFDTEEYPKLRGVLYVTTSTIKPSIWIALCKSLELEYDRKIYK